MNYQHSIAVIISATNSMRISIAATPTKRQERSAFLSPRIVFIIV